MLIRSTQSHQTPADVSERILIRLVINERKLIFVPELRCSPIMDEDCAMDEVLINPYEMKD